jgi:16S rRNA (guanine966-N2)-methyltransferase
VTRIIGGVLGSLRLKGPAKATRPTSDRVKESIFSILESRGAIQDARVLDLFAGTGALGLEAASRGARSVTLVERDPAAAKVCDENLKQAAEGLSKSGLPCDVKIFRGDAKTFLRRSELMDLVFIDPPYEMAEAEVLASLETISVSEYGVVVVERSAKAQLSRPKGFLLDQKKAYGDTKVFLFVRDDAR